MRKSLNITGVRTIFSIERPIVVFEVAGHEAVVRNPKQALIDLQNSGRALEVNANEFGNGIEGLSPSTKAKFVQELLGCIGAQVTGEISVTKAGEKYIPNANHPCFTDKSHKSFGTIKVGEALIAETDSVWVEGFLSIPLTVAELYRRDVSANMADKMLAMLGLGAPTMGVSAPMLTENVMDIPSENAVPQATANEAFGTAKAK